MTSPPHHQAAPPATSSGPLTSDFSSAVGGAGPDGAGLLDSSGRKLKRQVEPGDSFWRGFFSVIGTAALILLLALAAAVAVVPAVTNGAALTILSGSMRPTLKEGDLVVVKGVSDPTTIKIGQIITFLPNPDDSRTTTHRVIGKGFDPKEGVVFTTRGDNNGANDDPVYGKQVRGVMLYYLPKIGHLTNWLGGEKKSALVLVAGGLIAYGLFTILFGRQRRPKGDQQAITSEVRPANSQDPPTVAQPVPVAAAEPEMPPPAAVAPTRPVMPSAVTATPPAGPTGQPLTEAPLYAPAPPTTTKSAPPLTRAELRRQRLAAEAAAESDGLDLLDRSTGHSADRTPAVAPAADQLAVKPILDVDRGLDDDPSDELPTPSFMPIPQRSASPIEDQPKTRKRSRRQH